MTDDKLYVIAVVSNPIGYESRYRLYRNFAKHMEKSGVELITVELAFEDKPFAITRVDNLNHVQVRTNHVLWHKENLINLGIQNLPYDWKYVAWIDADITFVNPNWVENTISALQEYKVVQLFSQVIDLGPTGESMQTFNSFGAMYIKNNKIIEGARINPITKKSKDNGGIFTKNIFWHPGFAWAARREVIKEVGGVMDFTILGSGDHLMALSFLGETDRINSFDFSQEYLQAIYNWQSKALLATQKNIGYVPGTIAHHFHGKKINRGYHNRSQILIDYQFNPYTDLVKDKQGVYELIIQSERQQKFADALYKYFESRKEDDK